MITTPEITNLSFVCGLLYCDKSVIKSQHMDKSKYTSMLKLYTFIESQNTSPMHDKGENYMIVN